MASFPTRSSQILMEVLFGPFGFKVFGGIGQWIGLFGRPLPLRQRLDFLLKKEKVVGLLV